MHFYTHEMPKDEGVRQLNESAWLLNLDTDLVVLAKMVSIAHDNKLPHQVLFFDQKPVFATALVEQKA